MVKGLAITAIGLVLATQAAASERLDKADSLLREALKLIDEERAATASPASTAATAATEAPAAATPTPAAATKERYKPGAVVIVRPSSDKVGVVPADDMGKFIYEGGPLLAHDTAKHKVQYRGIASFELQGYLPAKETGRYLFAVDISLTTENFPWRSMCSFQGWVDDAPTIMTNGRGDSEVQARDKEILQLHGGAELAEGLHRAVSDRRDSDLVDSRRTEDLRI